MEEDQGRYQGEKGFQCVGCLPCRGAAAAGQRLEAHCTARGDVTCRAPLVQANNFQKQPRKPLAALQQLRAGAQRTGVPCHAGPDNAQEKGLLRITASREHGLHKNLAAAKLTAQDCQVCIEVTASWCGVVKVAQAEAPPVVQAQSQAEHAAGRLIAA